MHRKCTVSASVWVSQILIPRYWYQYWFLKGDIGASLAMKNSAINTVEELVLSCVGRDEWQPAVEPALPGD